MSENFCILIPSKVFQVEKHFYRKLKVWVTDNFSSYLPNYSVLTLSEFRDRQDVNLDLPEKLYSRYHVIDWEFYFMESQILKSFLSWLANIYAYGEVGLLNYWSNWSSTSFPPVTVGSTEKTIWNSSTSKLPLDKLLFFPLTNYSS